MISLNWSDHKAGIKTHSKEDIFNLETKFGNAITATGKILLPDQSFGELVPRDVAKFYRGYANPLRVFVCPLKAEQIKSIEEYEKVTGLF